MAFFSNVGSILKQSVNKQLTSQSSASNASIFQALRWMSSSKVCVGGLPWIVDDTSLREGFSQYGEVVEARVIIGREQNRSKGCGFVTFASSEEASNAVSALDGQDFQGCRVKVNFATEMPPRQSEYGGYGVSGGFGPSGLHTLKMPRPPSPFTSPLRHHSSSSLHLIKPFSSKPSLNPIHNPDNNSQIPHSLSSEILKPSNPDSLPLPKRLDLSFSHITLSKSLILETLNVSPDAGRSALDFLTWVSSKTTPEFELDDEVYSYFVEYFGRRKDFKVIHDVILGGKGVVGRKTFDSAIDRLVRAGRATQAVTFFEKMEIDYGISRDRDSLNFVVSKLCENGFASSAEKMVKSLANEFFPDGYVCDVLIKGWCVDGKLEEAKRLAREMYRGGFEIGTVAYNAILNCVCKLCRVKDHFKLQSEAETILVDMDAAGVPRNTETFNILIENLCKLRKTEDAMKLFFRMGEWGCSPDETTFVILTRSLYQAARIGEGDEMIDRMKSAGFGGALDKKTYYGFVKILCGIERIDHALSVFAMMKDNGCKPGVKTYDLLIGKLYAHGCDEKAKALSNEAHNNGVLIELKVYKMDPRLVKKPTIVKKGKKRLTLPEKMVLKRKKLRKIRLSFVKKPKKGMRRAY